MKEPKRTERKEPDTLGHCVLPYYLGLSERIGRIVRGSQIGVAYKPLCTICNVISKLKDPIPTGHKSRVVYHSPCKDCDQFYIGETGRNLKQWLDEHDRAIRLRKVIQSAIAHHCLQSGHKFDFDGPRVLDTTSNKRHRLILEAWYVKSREGGRTGEMVEIPIQYTPLMQIGKNGWCKGLDKVSNKQHPIPDTTSTCAQHPMRTTTLAQPTPPHAQPGHETSHVRAPETQKQQAHTHTCSPTHMQHQITCK